MEFIIVEDFFTNIKQEFQNRDDKLVNITELKRIDIRVEDSELYLFSFFFSILFLDLELRVSMILHICHISCNYDYIS